MTWVSRIRWFVVDHREQKQGVRLGQQFLVQRPAGAPGPASLTYGASSGMLSMAVVNSDPQRFDQVQIFGAAGTQPPRRCHQVTLAQQRVTPSAMA